MPPRRGPREFPPDPEPHGKVRCPAPARSRPGEQCRNYAIPGGSTCRIHGSGTAAARAAAASRLAVAESAAAVVTYGGRREIAPADALLELVACSAGHVAWLAARVAEVDAKALTVGVAEQRVDADGAKTVIIRSAPNVWLDLYHRERRFLADVCAAALRAGVEDRAVRLAERQGDLVCAVLAAVFADPELGLTAGQRAVVDVVVPRHLRAVADNAGGP